jgi:hypothetical protein
LVEVLPEHCPPTIVADWADLLEEIDAARSLGAAELALIDFRSSVEARLDGRLPRVAIEEVE